MTSVEKLQAMLGELQSSGLLPPMLGGMLRASWPLISQQIPQDPGELDELLVRCARWALATRSDDAPAVALEQLLEEA